MVLKNSGWPGFDQATRLWSKLSMPPPPQGKPMTDPWDWFVCLPTWKPCKNQAKYIANSISVPWDLMGFFFWMETYGKLSHHHWVGNLLSMNFDIFLNKNTMRFFLGGGDIYGIIYYGSRNPGWVVPKNHIFSKLKRVDVDEMFNLWLQCCLFFVGKNKKTRLAWTFSSTSLHMSELYWHTGIVIKSCGKQEKNSISGEGKEMRNLFRVQKELNLGYKHQWALPNDMKAIPSRRIPLVFQCSSCMSAFAPTLIFINWGFAIASVIQFQVPKCVQPTWTHVFWYLSSKCFSCSS